jgi:gas vesicle protein
MSTELIVGLAGALVGGLITLVGTILMLPKIRAEARKLNADADDKIVARLYREIDRLDVLFKELEAEFSSYKRVSADEKRKLENENRSLRTEVSRLRRRVEGLEAVIKVGTITPDMQAMLDEIDRHTGGDEE